MVQITFVYFFKVDEIRVSLDHNKNHCNLDTYFLQYLTILEIRLVLTNGRKRIFVGCPMVNPTPQDPIVSRQEYILSGLYYFLVVKLGRMVYGL